jgi:hypothetical protein
VTSRQDAAALTPAGAIFEDMTVALRLKVGGLLVLALAGLSMGAAAGVGLLPTAPPVLLDPALAAAAVALTVVKLAAVGGGVLALARGRE